MTVSRAGSFVPFGTNSFPLALPRLGIHGKGWDHVPGVGKPKSFSSEDPHDSFRIHHGWVRCTGCRQVTAFADIDQLPVSAINGLGACLTCGINEQVSPGSCRFIDGKKVPIPAQPGKQSQRLAWWLQFPRFMPFGSQLRGQARMLQASPLKSSSQRHRPSSQVPWPEHVSSCLSLGQELILRQN